MPEEKYTRCPGCATVFRVTAGAARAAQRAGALRPLQDGVRWRGAGGVACPAARPNTTSRRWTKLRSDRRRSRSATRARSSPRLTRRSRPTSRRRAKRRAEAPYEDRFAPPARPASGRRRLILYAIAIVVLVLLISRPGDLSLPRRDRRALAAGAAGSAEPVRRGGVRDPSASRRRDGLPVDRSVRSAGRSCARGLLILTATLRNRAPWALSYPYLELTLTDAQDRVVVRRALAPADYAGGTADLQRGIASNGEAPSRYSSMRARRPRPDIGFTCSTRDGRGPCAHASRHRLVRRQLHL